MNFINICVIFVSAILYITLLIFYFKQSSLITIRGYQSIPVWLNMIPKQSLRTEMTHFLSLRTGTTHTHKFEDWP